jgi:hypothetical protein
VFLAVMPVERGGRPSEREGDFVVVKAVKSIWEKHLQHKSNLHNYVTNMDDTFCFNSQSKRKANSITKISNMRTTGIEPGG